MEKLRKTILALLSITFMLVSLPADGFPFKSGDYDASAIVGLKYDNKRLDLPFTTEDKGVFPNSYPAFLKQVYILLRQIEGLENISAYDRESILETQEEKLEVFFRNMLSDGRPNLERLCNFARARVGEKAFEAFLKRFGIDRDNRKDMELEVQAQIHRMRRRESYCDFVNAFSNRNNNFSHRITLVEASTEPSELEYALRQCEDKEFKRILNVIVEKAEFGPQTSQDWDLFNYLQMKRRIALDRKNEAAAGKWRTVIAQLISQPVRNKHHRLPFSKWELFAMMRNTERTLEQRRRPFIDITDIKLLDKESSAYALEMIEMLSKELTTYEDKGMIAYGFLDSQISVQLKKLTQTYEDILHNTDSGQPSDTRKSVQLKKELLERLELNPSKNLNMLRHGARFTLPELVQKILEDLNEPYRFPFIRGIILLRGVQGNLAYRFIEDFPMIVAGETYPYQWKHDNEVNIALLLANVDPYYAAQAVRFIIYYGMWRSEQAKELALYGWLPQIIFGDRQTGKQPEFNNRTYYYFPDFRFRPTKEIDGENERNRTSEIMQLPFFGWTVWRVYEEMKKTNEKNALAFLMEVYPYVRANTEAIRTALDPYNEAVLSGRDAWVNGMDNAWYHIMVMARHLPERLIPKWSYEILNKHRVDNRMGKRPGNPVDPDLAEGRPSDYYYAFRTVFYDIIHQLNLEPERVYHATPYNAKDVAITSVMARSLAAQIAMAKILKNRDADIHSLSALRDRRDEIVEGWNDEINRYQTYLDRMKRAANHYLWSPEDYLYYNRDVTQMFPSVIEQQFCYIPVNRPNQITYKPRMKYWDLASDKESEKGYIPSKKAKESKLINDQAYSVWMDLNNNVHIEYKHKPDYWEPFKDEKGKDSYKLNVDPHDPFIVEQFCRIRKRESDGIWYEPDMTYWRWVKDDEGIGHYELNARAKNLLGTGARKIEDGDLIKSPAIASFFPLFGHIPTPEQAFKLSTQVVNPWMWWPENGLPIPTQPMMKRSAHGRYIPNKVYDPNKYWQGPTWMSSTKPVIDGFYSYGYEMLYLYLVNRSIRTLQDGRAVEHWNPETGEVNTSNINFPWAASCMAGSIWPELTKEEQNEYLRYFHPRWYGRMLGTADVWSIQNKQQHYSLAEWVDSESMVALQ